MERLLRFAASRPGMIVTLRVEQKGGQFGVVIKCGYREGVQSKTQRSFWYIGEAAIEEVACHAFKGWHEGWAVDSPRDSHPAEHYDPPPPRVPTTAGVGAGRFALEEVLVTGTHMPGSSPKPSDPTQ